MVMMDILASLVMMGGNVNGAFIFFKGLLGEGRGYGNGDAHARIWTGAKVIQPSSETDLRSKRHCLLLRSLLSLLSQANCCKRENQWEDFFLPYKIPFPLYLIPH